MEIPKSLQAFIARDIIYIIGGGCVVVSFLHLFDQLVFQDLPIAITALSVGIAYVVGYAMQDAFSLLGLVTTQRIESPNPLVEGLYRRFTRQPWADLREISWEETDAAIRLHCCSETDLVDYQRVVSLMQVGTTMGPCCLVSALLLLLRLRRGDSTLFAFDVGLLIATALLTTIFFALAWIKVAQYTQLQAKAIRNMEAAPKGNRQSDGSI